MVVIAQGEERTIARDIAWRAGRRLRRIRSGSWLSRVGMEFQMSTAEPCVQTTANLVPSVHTPQGQPSRAIRRRE